MYYSEDNIAKLIIREVFAEDSGKYTVVAKNTVGYQAYTVDFNVDVDYSDKESVTSRKSLSRELSIVSILEEFAETPKKKVSEERLKELEEIVELKAKKEPEELIATITVVSETPTMLSVSEGDRIYVVERHTSDWWFVRKRITNESGYIESKNLVDSVTYTHILRDKVDEKIDKIPVYQTEEIDNRFAPRFTRDLQCIDAFVGETVTFECQVEGNPRPTITWFKHSSILKPNDEIQMYYSEDNTAKLIIREVFAEDSGKYTVVAKNTVGHQAYTVDLNVEFDYSDIESVTTSRKSLSRESSIVSILEGIPPVFAETPKSIEIKTGKQFAIEVCVSAQTKFNIRWLRNGIEIKESKRIQVKSSEDIYYFKYQLVVEKASEDDEGIYEIIAENKAGIASTTVVVYNEKKKQKPAFIQTFGDVFVEEESETTLSVKYTGHPKPQIQWFRNGKSVKASKTITQRDLNGSESSITIENVVKVNHSGVYKCVASNAIGQCEHSAKVAVISKELRFVERLQETEVQENSKTLLVVKISSDEEDVRWHKNGELIDENNTNFEFIKEGFYRKLLIRETLLENEGEYTCVLGKDNECSADLIVIELPPKIITELEDKSCVFGQTVNFNIELSKGDAIVKWFKDDKSILCLVIKKLI
ncbi:unnamed protein product [Medioppia subpectinata]|uniref:Titin n=1 Tax=Medioppia subpectinata TaxID=1979941 RepID=A0A7R9KET0_9ACAR|nr:unnamed protein product [Medioppia subpectinata]CAG2101276.1 unnamed protein product [Medioppia subpectinata]